MRRTWKRWMVAGLFAPFVLTLLAAWPVYSEGKSLKQLLSGRDIPTTIEARELTKEYRVIRIGQSDELTILQMQRFGWNALKMAGGEYYTTGETVKAGETAYLIAYRVVEDPRDIQRRMQAHDLADNPLAERKLGPSEKLTLSLLNLRTTGNLTDVRAFDPAKEVYTETEYKAKLANRGNRDSVKNLRQLSLGILQYLQDYDEQFPPMNTATSFQQIKESIGAGVTRSTPVQARIFPYVRNKEIFRHPVSREIYRFNLSLSFKNVSTIERPAEIALAYEGSPAPDGTRGVAFVDGHVSRMKPEVWERFRKISGIPAPRATKAKSAQSSRRRRSRAGPSPRRTRTHRSSARRN